MQFRILGRLEITCDNKAISLAGRQLPLLVARLLCDANKFVSADDLIASIWPEGAPRTAKKNLQVHIYQLRRLLGEQRISTQGNGYSIVVHAGELDSESFLDLIEQARKAEGRERARELFVRAEQHWRGAVLSDVDDAQTLRELATRLTEVQLSALEDRLEIDLEMMRHQRAVSELQSLVDQHPFRERLHGLLMLALHRSGRRKEALQVYQRSREILARELGIEPSTELQEIQVSILRGTNEASPPQGGQPPARFIPSELPPAPTHFTGRTDDLAKLNGLFNRSISDGQSIVLSAVAGMGGIGKTALAVHWARAISHRFPDGQLFVNLNGYAASPPMDSSIAVAQMLRSLGVAANDIPANMEQLLGLYRTTLTGRRVLIVLDNAASAEQVRPLLPASTGCLAVVTSRARLDGLMARDGATRVDLDLLTVPETLALLSGLLGVHRINQEPVAAAQLAVLCGYLPLAVRVAASHLTQRPQMKIGDLVAELKSDRLSALDVADDPQTSVQSVLDHSYRKLPADAQRMFRLIGVGPCHDYTAATAAILAGLTNEHARSLLLAIVDAALIAETSAGRFTIHDLAREFAQTLAAHGDQGQVVSAQRRLGDWYVATADHASQQVLRSVTRLPLEFRIATVPTFSGASEALTWLKTEKENLRAFVLHFAAHGPVQRTWALISSLRGPCFVQATVHELEDLAQIALSAAESASDEAGQAICQLTFGGIYRFRGDFTVAVEHFTMAATLAREAAWDEGEAAAHASLGEAYQSMFILFDALRHGSQSFSLNEKTRNVEGMIGNHICLGEIHRTAGNLNAADHHEAEAIRLSQQTGIPFSTFLACFNRAITKRRMGDLDEALRLLAQARSTLKEIGVDQESMISMGLANVYLDTGDFITAEALLTTAMTELDHLYDKTYKFSLALSRSRLFRLTGRASRALDVLSGALNGDGIAAPAPANRILMLTELIETLIDLDRAVEAIPYRDEIVKIVEGPALSIYPATTHTTASRLSLVLGHRAEAERYARQAVENATITGQRPQLARALTALGRTVAEEQALPYWEQALSICNELRLPEASKVEELLQTRAH